MADVIITQDPTKPGVNKLNGPPIVNGKVPLSSLATTGANPNDVVTFSGGVWTPVASSGGSTASNLGAGSQVFKSKVGVDFQFRSLVGGTNITVTQNANDITILSNAGIFTKSFASTAQTITANGSLTIAHGMATKPLILMAYIKCTSADANWSIGDEIFTMITSESVYGMSIRRDATNLLIRFVNGSVFSVVDSSTGAITSIDATKWQLYFLAWA